MANPGVGNKYVSVNLNKSYGQQHHNHHPHHASAYGTTRTRPGSAGGGGMVVLSRPRSSHKTGLKLSVPPPLNLPSLRKEHERFDSLGSSGGPSGGVSGSGSRRSSSSVGWTKPATISSQEKEVVDFHDNSDPGLQIKDDGVNKGIGNLYTPPTARSVTVAAAVSGYSQVDKAAVLRAEDFPSLHATLLATVGNEKKQKDGLNFKQKQLMGEDFSNEQRDNSQLSNLHVDMRPQFQASSRNGGLNANGGQSNGLGYRMQARKQDEYFLGPLPLVSLNPRSDWEDDERDTGHSLTYQSRDHGLSKNESYWDRDFDTPRASVLPLKPAHSLSDRWVQRDNETGRFSSSEVPKSDPSGRDIKTSSKEEMERKSWRAPLLLKESSVQDVGKALNGIGVRPTGLNRETVRENKYISSPFRDNTQFDTARRELGHGQRERQSLNNSVDSHGSRQAEWNIQEGYGSEQPNRYRGNAFQNSTASKPSYSSVSKVPPINDPILNFGREKHPFLKSEKTYLEDPFMKDYGSTGFDGRDPFSGGHVGVVKRKKDVVKQTDFHDPVRESFEAELERVQKMQELERQRIIEEQEKAMELAQREEVERLRLAREEEERQRRLEEEAREATWRAEHEQIEALRRSEEQRIAREEEKHMMIMEEERRKQAAMQKLMELEEKIAKRQAEVAKGVENSSSLPDVTVSALAKEKGVSKVVDVNDWEDGERMVERITSSASSDSSSLNRHFEMGSRPQLSRDVSSSVLDRGKPVNSRRRDVFENGPTFTLPDQDNGRHSPVRDTSSSGRAFSRKEFLGGAEFAPSRTFHKGGILEPHVDDFSHFRGQRWNVSGDGDHYRRHTEVESEYHENLTEKFGDTGWGHDRFHGSPYTSYSERLQPNSEADDLYSFGRSRYTMRQPRVLPPPPFTSMNRSQYRGENELTSTSNITDNQMPYDHGARSQAIMQVESGHQGSLGQAEIADIQQDKTEDVEQKLGKSSVRCDSQSSLSVTSPPVSPIHLSHDDMEESEDSPVLSAAEAGKEFDLSRPGSVGSSIKAGKENVISASASIGDDEEWAVDNNEQLQEQEEYDEDEDRYQEEDEVHDIGDDLVQEFEEMHLEEKDSSQVVKVNNLVLGFNEGVEVGMPCDEFERSDRNEETTYVMPHMSVATVDKEGSFNVMDHDGQVLPSVNGQYQVSVDNSSGIFLESERAMQDLAIQPSIALETSASSDLMDHVNISNTSGSTQQHSVSSSLVQTVLSTVTSAPTQTEVPVKLQFGLFTGPSLIPSPIQAIQIGSIQMPLHLHPQVGPSLAHVHTPQPPLFQFGQLSYTTPISQGVLSLAPQSMSFVQPNVPASFSLHQDRGGSLPGQPAQDIAVANLMKNVAGSTLMDNQPGLVPRPLDLSHGIGALNGYDSMAARKNPEVIQQDRKETSLIAGSSLRPESELKAEDSVVKNLKAIFTKDFEGQSNTSVSSSQSVAKEKDTSTSKGQGSVGRGKKYIFAVKNSGSRSSLLAPDAPFSGSSGIQRRPRRQRTEFRVRENADKKLSTCMVPPNQCGLDDKSYTNGKGTGISTGIGSRAVGVSNRPSKQTFNSEALRPGVVNSQGIDSQSMPQKGGGKESSVEIHNVPHSADGTLKRNIHSEVDVDTPLQSGIVRVFEQLGIEAPSDEDDFIEVRSKRQMLNDRREQREKEIKAKARVTKTPRKPHSALQNIISPGTSNRISTLMIGEGARSIRSDFVASEGHGFSNSEVSAGFNSLLSQPLAPVGTPAVKSDIQSDIRSQPIKSLHTNSLPVGYNGGKNLAPASSKVLDNVQKPLSSWGNSHVCQQVLAISQAQLDEAMKPAEFDSRASIVDHSSSVMSSSSILAKDKSFPSTANPINSLLAGEKIQFGAVTSPTILPPVSHGVSNGIGPSGACRADIQNSHNLSSTANDCSLFFEKDKHSNESCVHLEDSEAEAEAAAAASAIAVAAISSDDIVGNDLGSIAVLDTKSFVREEIYGTAAGVAGDLQSDSQSRAEESPSLALPADLSVETPPISLWPPLPSPQNTSSQMLSHFSGAPHSHFPFYEMNPMLGGPFFAFGLHDESSSNQSQSQKSSKSGSGPLGTWQQCHSGVDSFYGPQAGFTGPFIGSPAGIPGVQGPPHMVVYNHFAPVGQFGQVGLSFMGTTYIPSGKQPDWKHNPASSAMNVGEGGEMSNLNMVSVQRSPNNMPAIQHLAPGSPLVPMASPWAMFDVSPFQSSPDMPVQAHWSHISASPLQQSVPMSMPLQQPAEVQRPQFNPVHHLDQSLSTNRFPDSQTSASSDNTQNFTVSTHATVSHLPVELGLVDQTNSTSAGAGSSIQNVSAAAKSSSMGGATDVGKSDVRNGSGSNNTGQNTSSASKASSVHHKNTSGLQYGNSSGYDYQRGSGISQRSSSGGEWSYRRMGFQGKNKSSGPEKSYSHSKMKQIYVAKQTNGTSRAS